MINENQGQRPLSPKHPKDVTGDIIEIDEAGKVSLASSPLLGEQTTSLEGKEAHPESVKMRGQKSLPVWSESEDDDLQEWYASANGAFHSYRYMAGELNRRYHGGKNVRKIGAVCRRDGHVNYGKSWGRKTNGR